MTEKSVGYNFIFSCFKYKYALAIVNMFMKNNFVKIDIYSFYFVRTLLMFIGYKSIVVLEQFPIDNECGTIIPVTNDSCKH